MACLSHHIGCRISHGNLYTTGICDTRMVKKKDKNKNDNVVSLDLYRSKKNLETIFELYTQMDRTWRWVDDTLSRAPRDLDTVDVYLAALKLSAERLHDLNFKTGNIMKLVYNTLKPKK